MDFYQVPINVLWDQLLSGVVKGIGLYWCVLILIFRSKSLDYIGFMNDFFKLAIYIGLSYLILNFNYNSESKKIYFQLVDKLSLTQIFVLIVSALEALANLISFIKRIYDVIKPKLKIQ